MKGIKLNTTSLNDKHKIGEKRKRFPKNMKIHEKMNEPNNAIWVSILIMLFWGIFVIIPRYITTYFLDIIKLDYITELTILFLVQFLFAGITLLTLIPILLGVPTTFKPYHGYLESIRLTNYKPIGKIIFIGITGSVFILFFAIFLPSMTGNLIIQPDSVFGSPVRDINAPENSVVGWFGFIKFLVPGIWEEVIGRGIILTVLLRKYPLEKGVHHKAIALGGFLFGSMHLLDIPSLINEPTFVIGQVVWSTIIGIAWGYVAIGTNSLYPSIFIHWIIDIFSSYISFAGDINLFLVLFLLAIVIGSGLIILLVYQTTNIGDFHKKKL